MKANYIQDVQVWENEFEFFVEVRVRFSETDMYGHLNNTVPFAYFEYARIEYFKQLEIMGKWASVDAEFIPVVADLECDYLKQVLFDEVLKIYVKIATVGNSSIDVHYMAKNEDDETCFTGRGIIVQINKKTGKSTPWKEIDKEKIILHGK